MCSPPLSCPPCPAATAAAAAGPGAPGTAGTAGSTFASAVAPGAGWSAGRTYLKEPWPRPPCPPRPLRPPLRLYCRPALYRMAGGGMRAACEREREAAIEQSCRQWLTSNRKAAIESPETCTCPAVPPCSSSTKHTKKAAVHQQLRSTRTCKHGHRHWHHRRRRVGGAQRPRHRHPSGRGVAGNNLDGALEQRRACGEKQPQQEWWKLASGL